MIATETAKGIKFDFGDKVEFAIKQGKDYGIVCEIKLQPHTVMYLVVWSDKACKEHYEFELKKVAE